WTDLRFPFVDEHPLACPNAAKTCLPASVPGLADRMSIRRKCCRFTVYLQIACRTITLVVEKRAAGAGGTSKHGEKDGLVVADRRHIVAGCNRTARSRVWLGGERCDAPAPG